MREGKPLWVEEFGGQLASIERETLETLGEETGRFFLRVSDDWLAIGSAVLDAYPGERRHNLVLHTFWGLFKEVNWLHLFFAAGNYPLLLSRLRFAWESMFRAYFAEHYPLGTHQLFPAPGPSPDDKLAWLDQYGHKLNWVRCIDPVLRSVFPLADREPLAREAYRTQWQELHRYVHPSAFLAGRMIGPSALFVTDSFDEAWAREAVGVASKVFDLIWLAVLSHHPDAFDRLERVLRDYPILAIVSNRVHVTNDPGPALR